MLKVLTIILASALTVLCLLQEDNNEGVMSIGNSSKLSLFENKKSNNHNKYLQYATWVLGVALFTVIFIQMI